MEVDLRSVLLLILLFLAGPFAAQATEPKAKVVGPKLPVAAGADVVLDATESVSDRPLIWRVIGQPASVKTYDDGDRKAVVGVLRALPAGDYMVSVGAVGVQVKPAKPGQTEPEVDVSMDVSVVEFKVGGSPAPPPTPPPVPPGPHPPPQPLPPPQPNSTMGQLGAQFGRAIVTTYAETMEESVSMLAAGVTRSAVVADFEKRWAARRRLAAQGAAAEFAKIAPDDRDPTSDQKAALSEAWREFAKGVRGASR